MAAPFTPDDWKALIPASNSKLCAVFTAMFRFMYMIWKWFVWMQKADGSASDEYLSWIGVAAGGLAAPTGVTATTTLPTTVLVTWTASAGALTYDVYRSTTNDTLTAGSPLAVNLTDTQYTDTTPVVNQQYFYWVRAHGTGSLSGYSAPATGNAGSAGAASGVLVISDTPIGGLFTFTGQATANAEIHVWGGGGGGGDNAGGGQFGGGQYGGSAGGCGEYRKITGISIAAQEQLVVTIGAGGTAGAGGAGGSGGDTVVNGKNGTTIHLLARAVLGQGGPAGTTGPGTIGIGGAGGDGGTVHTDGANGGVGGAAQVPGVAGAATVASINAQNYSGGQAGNGSVPGSRGLIVIKWS